MRSRGRPLVLALVLAGAGIATACHRVDRGEPAAGPSAPPSPPAIAAPATVLAPAPLAWSLAPAEAFDRLAAAGMAPVADEQRAYYSTPEQFHAAPGTIEVAHTVEPMVRFSPRPGWTGTAHYPTVGGALDVITLTARLSPPAAGAALAELERRHGPPDDRRTADTDPALAAGTARLIWVRGGVWLVAAADPDGAVTVTYRRDDRPASAITH